MFPAEKKRENVGKKLPSSVEVQGSFRKILAQRNYRVYSQGNFWLQLLNDPWNGIESEREAILKKVLEKLKYLGSDITEVGKCRTEIRRQLRL